MTMFSTLNIYLRIYISIRERRVREVVVRLDTDFINKREVLVVSSLSDEAHRDNANLVSIPISRMSVISGENLESSILSIKTNVNAPS